MKYLMTLFLVLILSLTPVYGNDITPEQQESVQVTADIFSMCVMDGIGDYFTFGFTTEFALISRFGDCTQEGDNLYKELESIGLSEEEISMNFQNIFKGMVQVIDLERNKQAMKRLENAVKKSKPNNPKVFL